MISLVFNFKVMKLKCDAFCLLHYYMALLNLNFYCLVLLHSGNWEKSQEEKDRGREYL